MHNKPFQISGMYMYINKVTTPVSLVQFRVKLLFNKIINYWNYKPPPPKNENTEENPVMNIVPITVQTVNKCASKQVKIYLCPITYFTSIYFFQNMQVTLFQTRRDNYRSYYLSLLNECSIILRSFKKATS